MRSKINRFGFLLLKSILVIGFFVFSTSCAKAQLIVNKDSTDKQVINPHIKPHSPRKAALMSTMLPGLGQVYNKKYWKLPIIYGGLAALTYVITSNQTKYVHYRTAYSYRIDDDPLTIDEYVGKYTDENLNTLQHSYHRNRDLGIIGVAAMYLLNIIDASVDAHLFTFDVNENLSFRIHPTLISTAYVNSYTSGFSLLIKL